MMASFSARCCSAAVFRSSMVFLYVEIWASSLALRILAFLARSSVSLSLASLSLSRAMTC